MNEMPLTLQAFWEQLEPELCRSTLYAPSTLKGWQIYMRNWVLPYLGDMYLTEIRPADVIRMLRVHAERSRGSVVNARSALRHTMQIAVTRGLISTNPTDETKGGQIPSRYATLSTHELSILCPILMEYPVLGPMYLFVLCTGLSKEELLSLRNSDLDIGKRLLRIGADQSIPLSSQAIRLIFLANQEHIGPLPAGADPPLFRGRGTVELKSGNLSQFHKDIRARTGLQHFTLNVMRFTFIRIALERGYTPVHIKEYMRYTNPSVIFELMKRMRNADLSEAVTAYYDRMNGLL